MMSEELKDLVAYRMEQSESSAAASAVLAEQGFTQESVSRSYYAMFYAVLALLATKELGTSKHSAAISLFDREFMAPRELSRELSSWLHDAFEKRLEADYALRPHITPEHASKTLAEAREFLKAVREYLHRAEP